MKWPPESEVVPLFVPFIIMVAPASALPSRSVMLPFIICWENSELIKKRKQNRKQKSDLKISRQLAICLIRKFCVK
jgi:hypothetical protein